MFAPERLLEISRGAAPAALCTVVATRGSTPRKIGASMVVVADGSPLGRIEGTVGGGAVEHAVRAEALLAIAETRPRSIDYALTAELGMCCGGQMTIFIEPLRDRPPCIVFGAGHVGQALAEMAHTAGFAVTIADPRAELLRRERFSHEIRLVDGYDEEDFDDLGFGPDAFVIIVTHDHPTDQALAERVLRRPWRYAALVGSRRKAELTRQRCLAKGLPTERVAALRSPAGLAIAAETPEEIAVSIVAQMVACRRGADHDHTQALSPGRREAVG